MDENDGDPVGKTLWAYAYEIAPPQAEDRLLGIQALLDQEHADALVGARTWAGRVVMEEKSTHILVVSDSLDLDSGINRKLEAELTTMKAGFAITIPMAVAAAETLPPTEERTD